MRCPVTYFFYSFYQIDIDIANKNIVLKTIQAAFCHTGPTSHNTSDPQVPKQSQGHPYETSWDIICNSFKQIDINISCKNIVLYTLQAAICQPGPISQIESDPQVVKQSQGHPYETSWDIICNSFKQIDINISCKYIVLYTLQAAICHPGPISQNKSDPQVMKQSQGHPYETSWDIPI